MINPGKHLSSTTPTPKCMVCTTPTRCGAPALHTKGPRCIGRADGKDDCDCLNACGDDPWIESGRSMPCDHRRETQARIAALTTAAPAAVAGPAKTSSIFALRTEPEKGESQWAGIYSNRADAEHDAEVMRSATGREWHVVTLAEASSATVPSTTTEAAAHEWQVSHTYGGEICANCGAVKGTRRGNAPCGEAAAPTTQPAPMESVLIDGIAYQTPAPVAAELLRLHIDARQPAPQQEAQEPVAWRELCRRLYVELFHCDQQMTSGERPKWQQGKTVRDVLADAKAALDAAHQPSPAAQEGQ